MYFKTPHNLFPVFYFIREKKKKKQLKVYCLFNFIISLYLSIGIFVKKGVFFPSTGLIIDLHIQFTEISENWFVF